MALGTQMFIPQPLDFNGRSGLPANVEMWHTLFLCILNSSGGEDNPEKSARAVHSFDNVYTDAENGHLEHLLDIKQ